MMTVGASGRVAGGGPVDNGAAVGAGAPVNATEDEGAMVKLDATDGGPLGSGLRVDGLGTCMSKKYGTPVELRGSFLVSESEAGVWGTISCSRAERRANAIVGLASPMGSSIAMLESDPRRPNSDIGPK
jgi:hypothetical protein